MFSRRVGTLSALAGLSALTLWAGHVQSQEKGIKEQKTGKSQSSSSTLSPSSLTAGQVAILDKAGYTVGICPLKHTDVNADIAGYMARVTVTQEFVNTSTEPIEAVYTFPLPEDAAVDAMTMQIGSRAIRGEIKKREEAREIYEAARTEGKTASLLDQERANIFTQSIANVMPGEKIRIVISYVNLLKYQEGVYEWAFPLVVGPRYTGGSSVPSVSSAAATLQNTSTVQNTAGNSATAAPQSIVPDADKITPPIAPLGSRAGHDVSISVHVDAGLPLQNVQSALHTINAQRVGPTAMNIRLQDKAVIPNKDFILRYTAAGSDLQEGLLAYADQGTGNRAQGTGNSSASGGYFTLIIQPPLAPPQDMISAKEMVFVIDQTGSQAGLPIEKAKETMRHCIQAMNPNDTFQLLAFNTENHPCFAAPVSNTPSHVQTALAFLKPLEGNGGTDILKATDYALKIPNDPSRLRIVCYMTDGYVGNEAQIIDYIGKHRGRARMFPFGVGSSVNRLLIEGMAREGRGASEYALLDQPGEITAARFYKRIASPILLDPQIDWGSLPVADVLPHHIPDVFSAGPIIVKGRYMHPGEGNLTLRGVLRGKPWQRTIHVVFPAQSNSGSAIPTLWAREKIADLQLQQWEAQYGGKDSSSFNAQIEATALDYHLMSEFTSFVAVEEKVVNAGGKQRRLDVPLEMPEGVAYDSSILTASDKAGASLRFKRGESLQRSRGLPSSGGGSFGGAFGRNGYGGRGGQAQTESLSAAKPAAKTKSPAGSGPAVSLGSVAAAIGDAKQDGTNEFELGYDYREIAENTPDAQKQLKALKPEERRKLLEKAKLAEVLRGLAEKVKQDGKDGSLNKPGLPLVEHGRVEVQIWLNALPADALSQLKALGFEVTATLRPHKLLLGAISVDKLNALVELDWIRRIEPPKFK